MGKIIEDAFILVDGSLPLFPLPLPLTFGFEPCQISKTICAYLAVCIQGGGRDGEGGGLGYAKGLMAKPITFLVHYFSIAVYSNCNSHWGETTKWGGCWRWRTN